MSPETGLPGLPGVSEGPGRMDPRSAVSSGRFLALLWACGLTTQWPPGPDLPEKPGDGSKASYAAAWTPGPPPGRTQETKTCPSPEPPPLGDRGKSCCPWTPCGGGLGAAITPGDIQCMPGYVVKLDHFAETEKTKPFLEPWLMASFLGTLTEIDGFHLSVSCSE